MKKYLKIVSVWLASIIVAVGLAVAISPAGAQITNPNFWRKTGNAVYLINPSWTLGDSSHPIPEMTVTTATITGISSGDLLPSANNTYDMGAFGSAWKDVYASGTILGDKLLVGVGSVGAPSVAFAGDDDTGIFSVSTGNVGLVSNGSEKFRVGGNNVTMADIVPSTDNTRDLGSSAFTYAESHVQDAYVYDTLNTGSWKSATDPGSPYPFMSFPLSATPAAGTRNNAIISMGSSYMMSFYGENTGAANAVQNRSVNIYAPRFKVGQANTVSYMYVGTTDGCMGLTFTTSSTFPTAVPTSTSFCL